MSTPHLAADDPRRLRGLFDRATALAQEHGIDSVFVGIAGREGDLLAPDFIAFVESELRVEDAVFRLVRERAVLLLTDLQLAQAEAVMERMLGRFAEQFASSVSLDIEVGFHPVEAGRVAATAKEILPRLFAPPGRRRRSAPL